MMLPPNPMPPLGGGRFGGGPPSRVMQQGGPGRPMPEAGRELRSFKKGGKVKKTGKYKLHKGEKVIPAKKSKKSDTAAFVAGKRA